MTALSPCNVCSPSLRDGCPVREVWREKVRGLGLTTARFRCERRNEAFRPGRRVLATITSGHAEPCGYAGDDYRYSDAKVSATIVGPGMRHGRVLVWIDDERIGDLSNLRNDSGLCSLPGQKLVFLDEPDRPERVAELKARDEAEIARAFA